MGFSGMTSKYLFLSICMDLTGLIWQLRGRDERESERDRLTEHQTTVP